MLAPAFSLYLASGSAARKKLLQEAGLTFAVIEQTADESQCPLNQSLESLVRQLAELKMEHIVAPSVAEGALGFFLTADTMTLDSRKRFFGKPVDRNHAVEMLISCRQGTTIGSGFCLEKRQFKGGSWQRLQRTVGYDQAFCIIDIPDEFLDYYLDRVPFTQVSGGITIEGLGEQFVREIRGSYSAILGMPMFKVREALKAMGFYSRS